MEHPTFYRNIQIEGLAIFSREAGPKDAPTLLLLHGLPPSSRMFEPHFTQLSDHNHLVAPDYSGFGHSQVDIKSGLCYDYGTNVVAALIGQFMKTQK